MSTVSIQEHVLGSSSKYISASRKLNAVKAWKYSSKFPQNATRPIVRINLSKVNNKVYDLSKGAVRKIYTPDAMANRFTRGMKEVIIENHIPPEALELLIPLT